jgi:hypothetical protein
MFNFNPGNILTFVSTVAAIIVLFLGPAAIESSYIENDIVSNNSVPNEKIVNKVSEFASRMLWMTHDRRFILPNGTLLNIVPSITIPVFRPGQQPFKGGLNSDIRASWYFYSKKP